jgi:hypothetical protein
MAPFGELTLDLQVSLADCFDAKSRLDKKSGEKLKIAAILAPFRQAEPQRSQVVG